MANRSIWYRVLGVVYRITRTQSEKLKWKRKAMKLRSEVEARVKRIGGGYRVSDREYRDTIVPYWSKYGIKPEKTWYSLYCNGMDKLDPRFIPETVWFCNVLPYFNQLKLKTAYANKGMFNRLIFDVMKPETVAKCMAGYYYDGDGEHLITREEAIEICAREEHLILKPFGGYGGSGIVFYDRDRSSLEDLRDTFSRFSKGFVAQRIIKQHPDLAALNPDSINTVRVLSFHYKDDVHILSAQLRIGGNGARVDNVSAGGSACSIYPDGRLHERSVTRKSTWTDETPNGIKLSSIRVPSFDRIVETVKRLHCELPYFNIIGWDFAVGEDGTPIMIEYNMEPAQNQIGGREPTFGDMTDEVLADVFIRKKR